MTKNRKILLGVCGSIAAYKAVQLVRLFIKNGDEVKVIMTADAKAFVQPLSFSTLSKNPVVYSFYNSDGAVWNNHVKLGLWADQMIIAPCTASTLAKMANGLSDNILVATYLSARCPVSIAPAMDLDMWQHPTSKRNIDIVKNDGVTVIDVDDGELASGLSGKGRMAEPENIFAIFNEEANPSKPLKGKKIVVSAGPTFEPIDPVRYIGNHSSGRMGIAIADEAAKLGAEVHLVLGPSSLNLTKKSVAVKNVKTAEEMYQAVHSQANDADVVIMAAAVADYTPSTTATEKMKKKDGDLKIELKRTKDILKSLGENKKANQILIGFALETTNEIENAKAKIKKKNLDLIVLNSLKDKGAGFKYNTNKVTFIDSNNKVQEMQLKSKSEVARDILNKVIELTNA